MLDIQTIVVGGGVVGLAVARALAESGREVVVLERASSIGTETSSRNSEVIHSGIYYTPGSLKARLCVSGRDLLYAYCERRDIPHRRAGKLIVATAQEDMARLTRYVELAQANGVGALEWLDADAVRALEPEVTCFRALHSPYTGVVDSHSLMMSFWADLQAAGGEVAFNAEVGAGGRRADGAFELVIHGLNEPATCRELVNCAGLGAPSLARALRRCGAEDAPPSYFARGHYFKLRGQSPFGRLVYPVAEAAGLGIHVTLDLDGNARFGPDVEWVNDVDYRFDASRRERFAAAIRRYYPNLESDRLEPDYVGVRPKISGPSEAAADFRIDGPVRHGIPGLVHLYGIESPGLTSCLAIATLVRSHLDGRPVVLDDADHPVASRT